jgi:hypothetical protein
MDVTGTTQMRAMEYSNSVLKERCYLRDLDQHGRTKLKRVLKDARL